ncbi:unnamed protein product [Durusdinium trenchii]|uniref:PPM-type phosphatase domain-containing protein n=1 Tax=Durusdinium trenchii TaxID=1381693 RepID=A0ABP0T1P9_9DINO
MGCTAGRAHEEQKAASRWYSKVLRKGPHMTKLMENRVRYLPLEIRGACVLVKMGGNRYRIDNSKLNDRAHGVCFRLSKNIEDRDDEHIAYWNDYVDGVDTGDGWISCDIDARGLEYLEDMEKETPLETLDKSLQQLGRPTSKSRMMIVSSSSSNVDGRWISRGYAGQKLIDGEHVQYGAGLSTTLVWEGLNSFSIDVGGERRRARLIDDSLVWNDGDVWTRDPRETRTVKPKEHWGDALEQLEVARVVGPLRSGETPLDVPEPSSRQDAWSVLRVEQDLSLYTIFDGHGPHGHDVANFAKNVLPRLLAADSRLWTFGASETFTEAFRWLHQLIDTSDAYDKLNARWSGCTGSAVLHAPNGRLYLAHVGDSSVVVGGLEGKEVTATQLTRDHKPELKDEMARIIASGGLIDFDGFSDYRIYNKDGYGAGLNMTRSLGDLEAHRETGLIADPECREYQAEQATHRARAVLAWRREDAVAVRYGERVRIAARSKHAGGGHSCGF